MLNVRCKHGEGIRIGDAFIIVDRKALAHIGKTTLRIQAPPEVQIDIMKRDNKYIPLKLVDALTP